MDIPIGFQFDPQSGLYYKEEDGWEGGAPVRIVTWLDPQSNTTQQVCYPAAEESPTFPEAAPSSVFAIPEGFMPYPGSDLYFHTENCMENGIPVQRVTYYNPAEGSYHQVDYPTEPPPEPEQSVEDAAPLTTVEQVSNTLELVAPEEMVVPAFAPASAEEEIIPAPAPMAVGEEPLPTVPTEMTSFDEAYGLLDPPPEPLLVPTGLPEQNPYAAPPAQVSNAPEASPIPSSWQQSIEQDTYTGSGMPQPLPKKKSKLAIVSAIAGVLVLVAIGVCGWLFGWFGGQSTPAGGSEPSLPPSVSVPDTSPDSSDPDESSEAASGDASGDASNSLAQLPVSIKVEHFSPRDANITLSGIPFQESYPASVPGKAADMMIYSWGVAFDDYEVSLSYFCEDENDADTIAPEEMQCNLWKIKQGGGSTVAPVSYEIAGDSITFYHVTLPAEETDAFDFSSPEAAYTVKITEGDARLETGCTASISKVESEETSVPQLESAYQYVDTATGMQVVLELQQELQGNFRLYMDLGGSTYSIEGVYYTEDDDILILEADVGPPPPIWQGGAKFRLQADGGLKLESPDHLGVLPAGGILFPKAHTTNTTNQTANSPAFPYAGTYVCSDTQIPKEYRPFIELKDSMGFTMALNTSQGMVEAAGQFAWDMQTEMLYLNFEHIGGGDPGDGYREAEVKILGENQLKFLTEGFGLMGYNDNLGIFTRQ